MIPYENFSQLSSHANFSYEMNLHLFDPILHNMVSERYRYADYEEEDLDSDSDVDEDEETKEVISDFLPRQEFSLSDVIEYATKEKNNQYEFMFSSFNSDFVPIKPTKIIQPKIEGSVIKIGEIGCFFNNEKQICIGKTLFDLADSELVPDLKCYAFSESVPPVFNHHRADFGISFAKIRAPSEIKKNDRSTGSKFCNDFVFFAPDLSSSFFDSKNHITIENGVWFSVVFDPGGNFTVTVILPPLSIATPPSSTISPTLDLISTKHSQGASLVFDPGGFLTHITFADVSTVSAKHRSHFVFDPGGALVDIVISIAFEHSRSYAFNLSFRSHLCLVFDPGRIAINRHGSYCHAAPPHLRQSPLISLTVSKVPEALTLTDSFIEVVSSLQMSFARLLQKFPEHALLYSQVRNWATGLR